ncbi:SDR family NAD(P)-dependent oxidoreductase [Moraxella bovoculi]|uniref:SDR family NAD(P)-dependent oxidoreductase n=1 Tax=Moraxella bovoculi TaxID=386891 RepID=UPI000624BF98|nr:glucose 1-dehydrogenase [Moraxella bovoculi]AKG15152.1 hypothetical protein AAX08_03355 [Moraxella bovoculi]
MRLLDKVALITGAGSGLGEYSAKAFAKQGAKIIITDINEELGNQVANTINADGGQAIFARLDVTNEQSWVEAVKIATDQFGKIDILINSAGMACSKNIEDSTIEDLRKSFALNTEGPFLGMKAVAPVMAKNGGGSIINIASMAGMVGLANATPYSTSKGATRLLSKSAASYYAQKGYNIRVNNLNPAYVVTPMLESVYTEEQIDSLANIFPLKRIASLDDVANALIYLASDESSFVTGFDLNLDSGYLSMK